jgi:hypothetical protein
VRELAITTGHTRAEYVLADFAQAFAAHRSLARLVVGPATLTRLGTVVTLELACPPARELEHLAARIAGLTPTHLGRVVVVAAKVPSAAVRQRVDRELARFKPAWRPP